MKKSGKKQLSNTEWIVMNTVYQLMEYRDDAAVSEVMEALKSRKDWNQSTVKTILERLTAKQVLSSEVRGKTCFYRPVARYDEIARRDIADRLDIVLEGALGPLVAYLADKRKLSSKQVRELEKLLGKEGI